MRSKTLLFYLCSFLPLFGLLCSPSYLVYAADSEHGKSKQGESKHGESKSGDSKVSAKKEKSKKKKAEVVEEKEPVKSEEPVDNTAFDKDLEAVSTVDAVLLIDASRSMLRTDPQKLRNQGAKLFLRFMGEGDRVGIIQFDRNATVVSDIAPLPGGDVAPLDAAIDNIPVEGNFTNLRAPIVAAIEMLGQRGRPDSAKCIILLSDGKMDPHPTEGQALQMSDLVSHDDLPKLTHLGAKLYTLALSPEADKDLLAKFAQEGGGQSFYTPDANTIHQKFSDLFLLLKKPQVLPLESGGFEIDNGVKEATFYVSRKIEGQEILLLNPQGKELHSTDLTPGIRWYRGQLFDVITITKPLPGRWGVQGLENAEGFATLVTDLKLQVRWPDAAINAGDTVRFAARLAEGDKAFEAPAIDDATFYTYRIIDGAGATLLRGSLNDKGEEGDEQAGDHIFGGQIKLEEEGDFRALVGVTAPTFTRSQQIPFRIAGQALTVEAVPPDEFGHATTRFKVTLSKLGLALKERKVKLAARAEEQKEAKALEFTKAEEDQPKDEVYFADSTQLKPGKYTIFATLAGVGAKKKPEKFESNSIEFIAEAAAEGDAEHAEEGDTPWVLYGMAITLSLGWSAGTAVFALKRFNVGGSSLDRVKAYQIPQELVDELQQIRERASKQRRPPTAEDLALVAVLDGKIIPPTASVPAAAASVAPEQQASPSPAESGEAVPEASEASAEQSSAEEAVSGGDTTAEGEQP